MGAPTGERNGAARLTAESVAEIRALAKEGEPHRLIARRFGVSKSSVGRVARRQTWRHVI
jgi:DNA invertase Pin-like site-specific DNA recombinase